MTSKSPTPSTQTFNLQRPKTDGTNGANTQGSFLSQLTTFTDDQGASNATKTATHIYGPYLTRASMPI